jgi:acyl-CoA reductase-like NAD-dependent aldehyde dehydrogenase
MEMNWSRWFHCESSFGLLLVPNQPGVFALAEEIVQPAGPHSRRMLAVFEVAEADDLARAMSRMFAAGSPWREKLAQARCYVRYALAPSIADRRAAATALKNWLSAQREVASQIFEKPLSVPSELELAIAPAQILARPEPLNGGPNEELKTMAERAVDRVTHGMRLSKASPAEI